MQQFEFPPDVRNESLTSGIPAALWAGVVLAASLLSGAAGCGKSEPNPTAPVATPQATRSGEGEAAVAREDANAAGGTVVAGAKEGAAPEAASPAQEPEAPAQAPGPDQQAKAREALLAELEDESKPLTAEQLGAAIEWLGACPLTEHGVDSQCEGRKAYDTALRKRNSSLADPTRTYGELGRRHIAAEQPALRASAAQLLGSVVGVDEAAQTTLIEAARKEADPLVLRAMLDALGARIGSSPDVGKLMLVMADHGEELVRTEAANWLTTKFGADVEGSLDKVIQLIHSDPSMTVRAQACKMAYRREDEVLVPVLWKYIEDPQADPAMYEACFEGLVHLWVGYPNPKKPSEQAYTRTLEHLASKPRGERRPASWAIRNIKAAQDEKWRAAASFFDEKRVRDAIIDIVKDRDAGWMTRSAAAEVLPEVGASRSDLVALLQQYEAADFPDKHVANTLDRLVKQLGE